MRKVSLAYELSNEGDYSADLVGAFNESSLSIDNIGGLPHELDRKLSTVTFGGGNQSEQILQKRRRRRNKKRFYQKQIQEQNRKQMFKSPQLTFQMRQLPKSQTLTPQVVKITPQPDQNIIEEEKVEEDKESLQAFDKDHIEKEFKQYLDFSTQREFLLPPSQASDHKEGARPAHMSPSKVEETHRIFQKHKRFSIYPTESQIDDKHDGGRNKQKREPVEFQFQNKERKPYNSHYHHQNQHLKKQRELKFNMKQGNQRHTKYKYQTHANQLHKVPNAPKNNNQFLISNSFLPYNGITAYSPRYGSGFQTPTPSFRQASQHSQQSTFQPPPLPSAFGESPRYPPIYQDHAFNQVGASMTMLINSDSFLNDRDLNHSSDNKFDNSHNDDGINFSMDFFEQPLEDNNAPAQNQADQVHTIDHKEQPVQISKKEQIIKEIMQQKMIIAKLMKEIGDKDRKIREITQRRNANIPNQ